MLPFENNLVTFFNALEAGFFFPSIKGAIDVFVGLTMAVLVDTTFVGGMLGDTSTTVCTDIDGSLVVLSGASGAADTFTTACTDIEGSVVVLIVVVPDLSVTFAFFVSASFDLDSYAGVPAVNALKIS